MGDKVFVYDRVGGTRKAAIYVEPDTGPKDAPFTDPMDHLEAIEFDTEVLDYMEVAFNSSVVINHSSVTAGTPPSGDYNPDPVNPSAYTATHDLLTHSLGYVPFVIVSSGGTALPPGAPIQSSGNSRRMVTPIVTTTKVQLRERVIDGGSSLSAGGVTYKVMVFKVPATDVGDLDILVDSENVYFKAGKFDSTRRYLRVSDGDTSGFWFWNGKTIDLANAVARVATTPTTFLNDVTFTGSTPLNYDGSFSTGDLTAWAVSVAEDDEEDGETSVDIGANGVKIVDDGNVVFDTSRRLAGIFQIVDLSNKVFTFPDPPRDYVYRQAANNVGIGTTLLRCVTLSSITPQEWTSTVELATLDSDQGDFLLGLVNGSRTQNPDTYVTSIGGDPVAISKMMEESVTIACSGSILLERSFFLRRSITFAIQGNKLVAILQQSTKDNVDTSMTIDPYGLGFPLNDQSSTNIECVTAVIDNQSTLVPTANLAQYIEGGANQLCSIASSSNYGSQWTFSSLKFAIGRISPGTASA